MENWHADVSKRKGLNCFFLAGLVWCQWDQGEPKSLNHYRIILDVANQKSLTTAAIQQSLGRLSREAMYCNN